MQLNTVELLVASIIKLPKLTSIWWHFSNFIRTLLYPGSIEIVENNQNVQNVINLISFTISFTSKIKWAIE